MSRSAWLLLLLSACSGTSSVDRGTPQKGPDSGSSAPARDAASGSDASPIEAGADGTPSDAAPGDGGGDGPDGSRPSDDPFSRLSVPAKGVCYDGFPKPNAQGECGYDPSSANTTLAYFGSDAAARHLGALWGTASLTAASCEDDCRDDLGTIAEAGGTLVRLYDWDPRNDHRDFLDHCAELGLDVLVPISNWFLQNDLAHAAETSELLLAPGNFGNDDGSDYHPAIAGVLIGNEPLLSGITLQAAIDYTKAFVAAERERGYRPVAIGHPVEFAPRGAPLHEGKDMPAWASFATLLSGLVELESRLMLCPNSYNDAKYLFEDAESSGEGYVALTHAQFGRPILFTEIGQHRLAPDYAAIIEGQLTAVVSYARAHPEQLLGAALFQFVDKPWMTGTTEGSFGMFSHGDSVRTLVLEQDDFTHTDVSTPGCVNIEALVRTPIYDATSTAFAK